MKTKFKVGDRVRLYGWANSSKGVEKFVHGSHFESGVITVSAVFDGYIMFFGPGGEFTASQKQCRKLIKKPRRRLWVFAEDIDMVSNKVDAWKDMPARHMLEFIEVKRKK